jgi:aryl-alcohol dehydrogenase-like predicted oxidoreductase
LERYPRVLGARQLIVSAIGLGCMGMSDFYGTLDRPSSIAAIRRAIELGITLIDTAPCFGVPRYGEEANEELVARALKGRRDQVVLATKVGFVRTKTNDKTIRTVNNSPAHISRAIDKSLARLRVEHVDLYYLHRRDPRVAIEEVVGAMAELVKAGKVRHLGLSEVSAETLRRACAVHPISVLQCEYSLISRHIEDEILPVAQELKVGIVAYAPIGRALLTGRITSVDALAPNDLRRRHPRFQHDNFRSNLSLLGRVREAAQELGCTPAQLALAWLLAKAPDIVPIPGMNQVRHVEENVAAADIQLTREQVEMLDRAIQRDGVAGERNTPAHLALMGH